MAEAEVLTRVDFPLYAIQAASSKYLVVSGGGGAAKTGVKNGVEIFELSHDGSRTVAKSVCRFETPEFAIMNMSLGNYNSEKQSCLIALGQDESTQVYRMQVERHSENKDEFTFGFTTLKSVQTDYTASEPYQKTVRISPDNKFMATGGADGFMRIWTFPDLHRTHEIEAHEKEIDDLDFSPDNTKIVTIGKDRRAFVWDVKKGKKHAEMGWETPKGIKYAFKRVKFGKVEGDPKRSKVYTIVNPVGASKPKSYLQRWDTKSFTIESGKGFEGSLSALAVSDNGNFVAVGTMFDGTIEIVTAYNMQSLKKVVKAHSTFITGLEFLPSSEEADVVRGFSDCSVASISVDHQICITHVPRLRTVSIFFAFFLLSGLLVLTFIFCSYLGL